MPTATGTGMDKLADGTLSYDGAIVFVRKKDADGKRTGELEPWKVHIKPDGTGELLPP